MNVDQPTEVQFLEEQDRLSYERFPQTDDEWSIWEKAGSWPED